MTKKKKLQLFRVSLSKLEKECSAISLPKETDPLEQLIISIVHYAAPSAKADTGLQAMRERFVDWNEVRVSAIAEIAEVFRENGIEEEHARTLKAVLIDLFRKRNELSLEFLRKYKDKQAEEFLGRLDSLPTEVADEVLLRSLGHPRFPLSPKIRRVCERLGLVDEEEEGVEGGIASILPKTKMARAHALFEAHADAVCKETPNCDSCTLNARCCYYENLRSGKKPGSAKKGEAESDAPSGARKASKKK